MRTYQHSFDLPRDRSIAETQIEISGLRNLTPENYFFFRYNLKWEARYIQNLFVEETKISVICSSLNRQLLRVQDEKIAKECAAVFKLLHRRFGQLVGDTIFAHYVCTLSADHIYMMFYRKELSLHCKELIAWRIDLTKLIIPILIDLPREKFMDNLLFIHSKYQRFEIFFCLDSIYFDLVYLKSEQLWLNPKFMLGIETNRPSINHYIYPLAAFLAATALLTVVIKKVCKD